MISKKVLIITPRFPFYEKGACDQDRATGIKIFLEKGFEAVVVCKALENEAPLAVEFEKILGIKIITVVYKFSKSPKRFLNPLWWDGAAFEYCDEEIQKIVGQELDRFKPDIVYFPNYMLPFGIFCKTIVALTEDLYQEMNGKNLPFRYRLAYKIFSTHAARKATAITVYSKTSGKNVSRLFGIDPKRIHVNYLGVR